MIKTLSDNVMIPIMGMIVSFVLVYELISMVINKNNLHDFNTAIFIRFYESVYCSHAVKQDF